MEPSLLMKSFWFILFLGAAAILIYGAERPLLGEREGDLSRYEFHAGGNIHSADWYGELRALIGSKTRTDHARWSTRRLPSAGRL
jgi:hypothetical protein